MIPRQDIKVKTSPAIVHFVSSMLDSQGMNSSTNHGVAKLFHVLRDSVKHNTPEYIYSDNPPSPDVETKNKIHPVMEEVVRKRFIDHLDNLQDPNDIIEHLSKISDISHRYRHNFDSELSRDIKYGKYEDKVGVGTGDHEQKTILTTFPKEEQETVHRTIVRLANHPNFDAANYGKQLSNEHHLKGMSSRTVDYKRPRSEIFSHMITHPEVRSRLLDDLDKIEKKSEGHRIAAAAIRGHMVDTYENTGQEKTRFLKKLADDPKSIDMGLYGYSKLKDAPPGKEWVLHTHEEQQKPVASRNTIAKDVHSNVESVMGRFSFGNPHLHTKDEILEHTAAADHIVYNHPTFAKNRTDSNRYQTDLYYSTSGDRINTTNIKALGVKLRLMNTNDTSYYGIHSATSNDHKVGLKALQDHNAMKNLVKRI